MEITEEVQKAMEALAGLVPVEEESLEKGEEESLSVVEESAPLQQVEESSKKEEGEEVAPVVSLTEENERLRQELNMLARQSGVRPVKEEAPVLPAKTESTADLQFLSDEEAEEIIDNPKLLNKFLNKVYQAGRETTMRDMPTLVRQQALMELNLQQKIQAFWSENKDLEQYRDFCSMVASQLEVENPSLGFDEVLEKTGAVTRERLNLPGKGKIVEEASGKEETPSSNPALPSGTRSARRPPPTPQPTGSQQSEMEDLAKAFGV